jgi:Skp family chaperone for outer membrane proteins
MDKLQEDIEKIAPQTVVGSFAKGRTGMAWLAAIAFHVVVIGGTSLDYIYYEWVNPQAGEQRRQEQEAKRKADLEAKRKAEQKKADDARAAETKAAEKLKKPDAKAPAATEKAAESEADKTQSEEIEKHKEAKVVKEVTEKASPKEIPKVPDDIGIDVKDTNPF